MLPHYPLPARYFAEPIAGAVPMWPLTLLALPALVAIRRSADRRVTVLVGTMLLGAASSIALIAALGLISHRFEMDFLPWFVLIACWLVGSATPGFRFGKFVAGIAILYSVLASLALGLRGPFDNFLQARPEAYVNLASWFSPVWSYRPLFNPRITIEAEYSFPANPPARPVSVDWRGPFGVAVFTGGGSARRGPGADHLLRLAYFGAGVRRYGHAMPGRSNRLRLDFDPPNRVITVQWNGETVLRHTLPFLITAPAQVTIGEDRAEIDPTPIRFPGRVFVISKVIGDRTSR